MADLGSALVLYDNWIKHKINDDIAGSGSVYCQNRQTKHPFYFRETDNFQRCKIIL